MRFRLHRTQTLFALPVASCKSSLFILLCMFQTTTELATLIETHRNNVIEFCTPTYSNVRPTIFKSHDTNVIQQPVINPADNTNLDRMTYLTGTWQAKIAYENLSCHIIISSKKGKF